MSERNWQEDWDHAQKYMPRSEVHELYPGQIISNEERLAYWLQEIKAACKSLNDQEVELKAQQIEIKSLREQLAHANSSWQSEKKMRIEAIEREGQEKKRADDAEAYAEALEVIIRESDEFEKEVLMMARAQQG